MVSFVCKTHSVSISRACKVLGFPRSQWYYRSHPRDDSAVEKKLRELKMKHPTRGFWKYFNSIRNEGIAWNHKRVSRVYKRMKLNLKPKVRYRLPARVKKPLEVPLSANRSWSIDFMSDRLTTGVQFRVLNVLDDFNREVLGMEISQNIPGLRLVKLMQEIVDYRGKPEQIRVDNGPEFRSVAFTVWCESEGISIHYIQPGKPTQNAYIERFNRIFRQEVLDAYLFENLHSTRVIAQDWVEDYNNNRPHESLGNKSPRTYLRDVDSGKPPALKSPAGFPHSTSVSLQHEIKN